MEPDSPAPSASPPEPTRPNRGRLRSLLRAGLGLGIFVALFLVLTPSWSELRDQVDFSGLGFAGGMLGSTVALVFTAWRWKLLNETWGNDPLPFAAYMHHLALTRVLGQLTSVVAMDLVGRTVGLRTAGSKRSIGQLLAPVLLERALDVLIPLLMLGWAFAVVQTRVGEWPLLSFAAMCLVAVAVGMPLLLPLVRVGLALYQRWSRFRGRPIERERPQIPRRITAAVAILGVARYVSVCLQFLGMGAAAGVLFPLTTLLVAAPVAQLSTLIGITPGGLGIQEAGWAGALLWQGEAEGRIALFLLATRLSMLVNFGILALLTWPWMRRAIGKAQAAAAEPAQG